MVLRVLQKTSSTASMLFISDTATVLRMASSATDATAAAVLTTSIMRLTDCARSKLASTEIRLHFIPK